MKIFLTVAIVATSLLPVSAFAMRTQTFEFSEGAINATWEGKGAMQMDRAPSGIILTTTSTGTFLTKTQLGIFPQEGSITASTEQSVRIHLIWIGDDDPDGIAYNVPIVLPAGGASTTVRFSLSELKHWRPGQKQIGLALPPGTNIFLQRITFDEWNAAERALEMVTSFWTFDRYQPYAINFVWGPQLASHPLQTNQMYATLPPRTISASWLLNLVVGIIIACSVLFVYYVRPFAETKRRILMTITTLVFGVWILLDLRMGSEFLHWVMHDHRTYISAPIESRTFRDRGRFYDFAAFAAPYVFDRSTYLFFTDHQWPFLGNIRYLTYPAIPGITINRDDTWVIFRRPDLAVDSDGRITVDGEPVSAAGKILGRFDDSSFVFRLLQAPTSAGSPPSLTTGQ